MAAVPLLPRAAFAGEGDPSGPRPAAEVSTFCSCGVAILSQRKKHAAVGPLLPMLPMCPVCPLAPAGLGRAGDAVPLRQLASPCLVGASWPAPQSSQGTCVGQWHRQGREGNSFHGFPFSSFLKLAVEWGNTEGQGVEAVLSALRLPLS